jgi:hypothetical protein
MKNKTWKKKKRQKVEHPPSSVLAYAQDLGTTGVKTVNNWDKQKSIATFTVTEMENKRRKEREVSTDQLFRPRPTAWNQLKVLKFLPFVSDEVCC